MSAEEMLKEMLKEMLSYRSPLLKNFSLGNIIIFPFIFYMPI
jgi:hypothetical protein